MDRFPRLEKFKAAEPCTGYQRGKVAALWVRSGMRILLTQGELDALREDVNKLD